MIGSYNYVDQYVKLKGKQINVGKGVARIFGLSRKGIVPIGRESYNPMQLISLEMSMSITYHTHAI
jgi:hypothetical protein